MAISDEEIRVAILDQFRNIEKAREAIQKYYYGGKGFDKKPGFGFDRFAEISDPNYITADDIVAVSTLGVNIPPASATWLLLDDAREKTQQLLRRIPTDIDIWDAGERIRKGSPLWDLWFLLLGREKKGPTKGIGPTKCSKLLAVKRPRLIPIQDSVLDNTVLGGTKDVWKAIAHTLSKPEDRAIVEAATDNAPKNVTLLRRMDVVLWMLNYEVVRAKRNTKKTQEVRT